MATDSDILDIAVLIIIENNKFIVLIIQVPYITPKSRQMTVWFTPRVDNILIKSP